jgi:NAD(P)-dependent dehydrogenase (short-subunit alcohol dehydrogenase family)
MVRERLAELQPLPRSGLPDDIAGAALWLASDEASFVTGHALVVDGGLTAGRRWRDLPEPMRERRGMM